MNEFLVLAVVFVSTLVHAVFGFGSALVAMPLLAMSMGLSFATPFVALMCSVINLILAVHYRKEVYWRPAIQMVLGSIMGIPVGIWLLKGLNEDLLRFILGLIIIGNSIYGLIKIEMPQLKNDRLAWLFGLIAGTLGGAYNTNGPPVVIYGLMRRWSSLPFIATMQCYFLVTGLLVMGWHGMSGLWTQSVLLLFVKSLPIILVAIWMGRRVQLSRTGYVFYIHALLIVSGILLMVRQVLQVF